MISEVTEFSSLRKKLNDDAIDKLEVALERAKRGEILIVGIAGVCDDGAMTTSWSYASPVGPLLGAVYHLAWRLHCYMDSDLIPPTPGSPA